jgi:hypothetical protein
MPAEASSILVNLSANLKLNHIYNSAVTAVEAVAHEAFNVSELPCCQIDINYFIKLYVA